MTRWFLGWLFLFDFWRKGLCAALDLDFTWPSSVRQVDWALRMSGLRPSPQDTSRPPWSPFVTEPVWVSFLSRRYPLVFSLVALNLSIFLKIQKFQQIKPRCVASLLGFLSYLLPWTLWSRLLTLHFREMSFCVVASARSIFSALSVVPESAAEQKSQSCSRCLFSHLMCFFDCTAF